MKILNRLLSRSIASLLLLSSLTGCTKEAKTERKLASAKEHLSKGDYAAAEIEYKNVLDMDPGNSKALRGLGIIWVGQGATLEGAQVLSNAKTRFPEDDEVGYNFAKAMLDLGFIAEGRKGILSLLDRSPANGNALMLLAESSVTPDLMTECEDRLELSKAKDQASVLLAVALIQLRRGEIEAGKYSVEQAIKKDPSFARAISMKGTILRLLKQPEAALEFTKKAAELGGPRSPELGNHASLLMELKRDDEATAILESATKAAPDYLPSWRLLGTIAFTQNKDDKATEYLSKVLAKSPLDIQSCLLQAEIWVRGDEPAKAVNLLEKLAQTFPSRPAIEFPLAKAHLAAGDMLRASAALDRVLSLVPGAAEATLLRTRLFLKEGKPAEAVKILEPIVSADPANKTAQDLLIGAYTAVNRKDDASDLLRKQMEISAGDPEPLFKLGVILRSEQKMPEARKTFEKALKLAPDNLAIIIQLASMDMEEGKADEAMRRVDAFVVSHPDSSEAYRTKAELLFARKEFKEAEASLEKAIELNPEDKLAYGFLVKILVDSGRSEEAVKQLEKFLQTTADSNGEMRMALGEQLLTLGRNEEALATFEKLAGMLPDFGPAYNNIAYIQSELIVNLDKAAENARKARALMPKNPLTADTLGWIESLSGRYAEALPLLDEAVAALPDLPSALYHRGITHYKMGNLQDAEADLEKALAVDTPFPEKPEALKRLEALRSGEADLPTLEQRAKENPKDIPVLLQLAQAQAKAGKSDDALGTYDNALKVNPALVAAHLGKFRIYASAPKDPVKALDAAKQASRAAPSNPEVLAALGTANYLNGNLDVAYGMLRDATSGTAGDSSLLSDLAMTAYGMGRIDEARASMERAVTSGLADQEAADHFLALTAPNRLQDPNARALAEKVLAANPNDVPSLMLLAELDGQTGKNPEERYRQILEIHPNFDPARKNLALILVKDPSKMDAAEALAIEARRRMTDDADLTGIVAIAAYTKGKYSNAIQLFKELALARPLTATEFLALGMSQVATKNEADARQSLTKAIELNLDEPQANQAKTALEELDKPKTED